MREAPRELGEGFAVYSAELKRAANRLHVYGHYRPVAAIRECRLPGKLPALALESLTPTNRAIFLQQEPIRAKRRELPFAALVVDAGFTTFAPNKVNQNSRDARDHKQQVISFVGNTKS